MTRLSSKWTFFYKRIFPALFVGFLILFSAVPLFTATSSGNYPQLPFFVVPIVMAVIFYVVMKKLIFDLVDEVADLGDALLVKNGEQEDRIALSDIININYTPLMSPPRVTLSLRKAGLFGKQVSFCAPIRFMPFASSPIDDRCTGRFGGGGRKAGHHRRLLPVGAVAHHAVGRRSFEIILDLGRQLRRAVETMRSDRRTCGNRNSRPARARISPG